MRKDLSVEYANVHYGWVEAIKHHWLEVHEQNPRHDQLGLKRTLNMRQDQVCLAIAPLLRAMPLYRHWGLRTN